MIGAEAVRRKAGRWPCLSSPVDGLVASPKIACIRGGSLGAGRERSMGSDDRSGESDGWCLSLISDTA